jgi:hypothetical protein
MSACFASIAPGVWAVDWGAVTNEERTENAAQFGIASDEIPKLLKWVTAAIGSNYPNAFSSLSVATEFYKRFVRSANATLIGLGLHENLRASFEAQLASDPNRGAGILERLQKKDSLPSGGKVRGFEPLGFSGCSFHTWFCNLSPDKVDSDLKVQPNEEGFISTLEEATKVVEFLKATGSEEAIWEPWLIVEYPQLDSARSVRN